MGARLKAQFNSTIGFKQDLPKKLKGVWKPWNFIAEVIRASIVHWFFTAASFYNVALRAEVNKLNNCDTLRLILKVCLHFAVC